MKPVAYCVCAALLSTWDRTVQFFADEYYVPKDRLVGEITAGLVVGLAVVPEAIAFALVVGILPQTGINTTLITSIVVGIFGDRPGLCNGE
jgi:MFS superfamily sulfate permease-like transporter